MVTKKAATKKATSKKLIPSKHPKSPFHPLYGRPILDAVKAGNVTQMRQIRATAVKHVKEVQAALAKLDAKIKRG